MAVSSFGMLRRPVHQAGKVVAEFAITLALIIILTIYIITQFGDVMRTQTSAAAQALAGESGQDQTAAAQEIAAAMSASASGGGMKNFAKSGSNSSYGSLGGSGSGGSNNGAPEDNEGSSDGEDGTSAGGGESSGGNDASQNEGQSGV